MPDMRFRDPSPDRTGKVHPISPGPTTTDPPTVTAAARAVLRFVAQDVGLNPAERKILAGYGRTLGLRPEPVTATTASGVRPSAPRMGSGTLTAEPDDAAMVGDTAAAPARLDLATLPAEVQRGVLVMMFRAAHADGRCDATDLAVLRRIADAMGVTDEEFAEVRSAFEDEQRRRRRNRIVVGAITGMALIVLAIAIADAVRKRNTPDDDAEMFARIDHAVAERARLDAASIESTSARLEQLERRIAGLIEQRERAPATSVAPSEDDAALREEILALKGSLAKLQSRPDLFKRLEARYHDSLVLIVVAFKLDSDRDSLEDMVHGTGFFVTPTGTILTNKHVVEPWKFEGKFARLLAAGYRLDESSIRMAAWPAGARVLQSPGGPAIFGNAYNNLQDTLHVAALPPDDVEKYESRLQDGSTYTGELHAQNNADLALLQAVVESPVVPLPLAPDASGTEKLDPVMVLGFPGGPAMLDSLEAEPSPSLGTVRMVDDTVQVTAPIVQGNSGGPLIDADGRVIGIATRTAFGESTLGVCIQSRHALELLPGATALVGDAARMLDDGHAEAARSLLDLAAARSPDQADTSRIENLRARLRAGL